MLKFSTLSHTQMISPWRNKEREKEKLTISWNECYISWENVHKFSHSLICSLSSFFFFIFSQHTHTFGFTPFSRRRVKVPKSPTLAASKRASSSALSTDIFTFLDIETFKLSAETSLLFLQSDRVLDRKNWKSKLFLLFPGFYLTKSRIH